MQYSIILRCWPPSKAGKAGRVYGEDADAADRQGDETDFAEILSSLSLSRARRQKDGADIEGIGERDIWL